MAAIIRVGFRFKPIEEELVYLLVARVKGEPFAWNQYPIMDSDLYGKQTPSEIFGNQNEKIWYCFTKLKKTSKKRVSRVAGNGTWHGETTAVEICDISNKIIGFKKTFTFKVKGVRDNRTNWIMHEYSLHESCDLVLCVIKKKTKKSLTATEEPIITSAPSINHHLEKEERGDQVGVSTTSSSMLSNEDQLKLQEALNSISEILMNDDMPSIPGVDSELVNHDMQQFLTNAIDFDV